MNLKSNNPHSNRIVLESTCITKLFIQTRPNEKISTFENACRVCMSRNSVNVVVNAGTLQHIVLGRHLHRQSSVDLRDRNTYRDHLARHPWTTIDQTNIKIQTI